MIRYSRYASAVVGSLATLCTCGGFALSLTIRQGGIVALTCLSAGVALACFLWWREARMPMAPLQYLLTASFALCAGLALYVNLAWALWALGVPVDIGTVHDGKMGQSYWLPPFTLIYATLCYGALHHGRSKKNQP